MIKDKRHYRLLVIEDNPGDFALVEEFLSDQMLDPTIAQAENFREAAALLGDNKTSFDAIILDLSLPDKSGQALVTEISRMAGITPVIILTGYADIDFSTNSISQGIADYLIKDELSAGLLYKSILYALERRKIVFDLTESEKRYSDLFHLSPQPMWVFEMDTLRFVQVNKAALLAYGYHEAEFLQMNVMDIKPPEDREIVVEMVNRQRVENRGLQKEKVRHRKKSGELIEVEIFTAPIIINHKRYISVIAVDVTEKNWNEHQVTKAIIKTQENERYEIGAELHDNVCQILAASKLTLGMLKESLQPNGEQWYNQCNDYIILASEEIRNLSHRLAPAFLDETNLEDAFCKLFTTFNLVGKYEIILEFDKRLQRCQIDLDLQLNLYRVLQEQLRNIINYAKASVIEVRVLTENNVLTLTIADNGIGYNPHIVKTGIGLANIKRRAELFSGRLVIATSPGNGCKMEVVIPLPELISKAGSNN